MTTQTRREETPVQPPQLVEMSWDPMTRIVGSLGIYTKIDFKQRRVVEAYSSSHIFRGYSLFMQGKDPRDAHFITSRICGICGDNHATCSAYTQIMAYGVKPPALGEWIINLGEAAEYMFDHNIFQENLVGVDFCEQMRSEEHTSELQSRQYLVCRLLLEKKKLLSFSAFIYHPILNIPYSFYYINYHLS